MISQCKWCDLYGHCTSNYSALCGTLCEERGCPFYSVWGGYNDTQEKALAQGKDNVRYMLF